MDDSLFEAARVIRPFLGQLVGPAEGGEMDGQIADLLDRAGKGEDTTAALREVLDSREATRVFTLRVIADAPLYRPPQLQPRKLRGIYPGDLPGPPQYISVPKYVCPEGDIVWYRFSVGQKIPMCQTHHVLLVEDPPE